MQIAASNSFFLKAFPSFKHLAENTEQREFYQQFVVRVTSGVRTRHLLADLGKRLIAITEQAYMFRRLEDVELVAQMLVNLPLPVLYRNVGFYYQALLMNWKAHSTEALSMLEQIVDEIPYSYRGRVIMSLAGLTFERWDVQSALQLYIEAGRAAMDKNYTDIFTLAQTQRQIAIIKGISGDHKGAVAHLENLHSIAKTAALQYPSLWLDYLNSLAVELGEVGRIEEARNICQIVLASPYASAYPEWRETGEELDAMAYRTPRSLLALGLKISPAQNVLPLPACDDARASLLEKNFPSRVQKNATVTNLEAWKQTKMAKATNGTKKGRVMGRRSSKEMDEKDMLMRVMEIFSSSEISEGKRRQMIESIENIISEKDEG